ncbi:MAG: hypothetical protein ACJ79C_14790 [Myxococcales bacterium]
MKKWIALPLVALAAACSSGVTNSSLSLSARAGSATTGATDPAATGVSISRIRIALRDLELRSRDGKNRAEIALGPVIVDLGAADVTSASVQKVLDSSVPAGTYDKIKLKIHRLQSAADVSGADDLVKAGASILIDGTFDGTAFQFATALEAEQELEGKFVIDGQSQNITINFDPSAWFVSGTATLDPSDPANKLAIEANIRASLAAFQDDDEVGHENHHGDDDAATHDAGDDNGNDAAGHDAGDDHGGATAGTGTTDDHGGHGNDDGSGHH